MNYRLLNEGEPIRQGDELWNNSAAEWRLLRPVEIGSPVWGFNVFRRPLGSETCDHLVGHSYFDHEDHVIRQSDFPSKDPHGPKKLKDMEDVFNFCPLCGMPLSQP